MMDLDQLQSVRDRERQTDTLQQLRESFYADAAEFVQDLQDRRSRAADEAEDPFRSSEVTRLTDRIQTAEQTVEAIYEQRVGKIVKAATFAAADLPTEAEGLTAEEQHLFDTLVEDIKENRRKVLDVLHGERSTSDGASGGPEFADDPDGDGPADETAPSDDGDAETSEGSVSAADVMGGADDSGRRSPAPEPPAPGDPADDGADSDSHDDLASPDGDGQTPPGEARGGEPPEEPGTDARGGAEAPGAGSDGDAPSGVPDSDGADVERRTVRITTDVGRILGVDEREYDLSEDDVVTLPAANAEPLLDGDAAEPIE